MIPPKSLYCPNPILIMVRGEILFQIQICPLSILSSNVMFYGIAAAPGNKLRFPKCWRWRSCGRPLIVIWLFSRHYNSLPGRSPQSYTVRYSVKDWPERPNTFREHLQRAIFETFDLRDIWSEWWENMTWQKKWTNKNLKTKTNTFREHLQRAIL